MMQKIIALALLVAAAEGSSKDASIYIIRHGEKNSRGDLSNIGQERAKCIATKFPGSEYNKPTALFAGHYSGGTPQRTLHTVQPTANNLGLKVDDSFENSDHSGAAKAFLAEVAKGNTVLAAWEHCNIRKTCYALASQSMCDQAFTTHARKDCDWWEVCSGCSDHYDGVVSLTVKNGKVTAVEHHHEDCKPTLNAPMAGVIDVSFADTSYTNVLTEMWSYDQHTTQGHAKHFDVGKYGGRKALRVRIYDDDKSITNYDDWCARSEMHQTDKSGLKNDVDYVAQWDFQLQHYTSGYKFAFMQLFGTTGPNIFLRYGVHGRDAYSLLCEKCNPHEAVFPGKASHDLGKWITWKVDFRLSSSSSGYLRIYRDGKEMHAYKGRTTDGSNHGLKMGLYTQHKAPHPNPCKAKDATCLLSNLRVTQMTDAAIVV